VALAHALETLLDDPAEIVRLHWDRTTVLAQDPRRELLEARVLGEEAVAVEPACVAVGTLDPPGSVVTDLDARFADDVADLPRRSADEVVDPEVGWNPEVALAPCREPDVAANARDTELLDLASVVQVRADDVPDTEVRQQGVRIERSLLFLVARDREVRELDRALLRDGALELAEPAGHLGRVVGIEDLDTHRGLGRSVRKARAAERQILQGQPQRLGVRKLSLQQVEGRLQGGELVVLEVELRQEVVLRAERVELLPRELVALRLKRDTEREQFGAVGVEAARKRFVGHLGVALDVRLHVPGGERSALRHQERDEGELTDQLVGVV